MAIFNMEDSSINEYINEHGGAHRRIIDSIKKEKDTIDDKHDKIDNAAISKEKKEALKSNLYKKEEELSNKSKRLIGTDHNIDDYARLANKHGINSGYRYSDKEAGKANIPEIKQHIKTLAAKKKPENSEMHRIINQRSKLKEAAEYILSVLDEMDYIEESEKKIGDRLKDAANRIHAMNRSAIDKAKDYIKDPKGYDKRQKEKFFKQDQK